MIKLSLYFFIYAFFGWCCEVSFATLKTGKFVNRGFLNGPICPIYGLGCVGLVSLLSPLRDNLILLFLASMAFTSLLEFVTGFALGKLFKQKWWDYSREPFNIMGYVCLRMSILWGLACVFVIVIIHPFIEGLCDKVAYPYDLVVSIFLYVLLIGDLSVSVIQLIRHKINVKKLDALNDQLAQIVTNYRKPSDAIGQKISDATLKTKEQVIELSAKIQKSRLVYAFPQLKEKLSLYVKTDKTDKSTESVSANSENAAKS